MNKVLTSFVAAGLLFAVASCGSDDDTKSSDTTISASDDTVAAGDTVVVDDTVASDDTMAAEPDTADMGDLQAAVYVQTLGAITDTGFDVDEQCLSAGIAKLSDEDAQLILDAGPAGEPDVSDAGNAIATEISDCLDIAEEPTATT